MKVVEYITNFPRSMIIPALVFLPRGSAEQSWGQRSIGSGEGWGHMQRGSNTAPQGSPEHGGGQRSPSGQFEEEG